MLPENTPQFDEESGVVTLPSVEGVTWTVDGKQRRAGKLATLQEGEAVTITAKAKPGFRIQGDKEWTFEKPESSSE